MQLGLFTCGYQRYPLARAFIDARRFGYDFIELWGGRPHAFAPDLASGDTAFVKSLIDRFEVPVRVYTPEHNGYPYNYMLGTEAQRRGALDYLMLAMDMGQALGAQYTLISAGHAGYLATPRQIRMRLVNSLQELARHGEKIGHTILLEPLTPFESNSCTTAGELFEVLEDVDSDRLLGMCDVVAPFVAREPARNYFDLLGKRLAHLHVVDSDGVSDSHLLPGEGCLPLKELLRELHELGYKGSATIELVTNYLSEPSLYARRAIETIRSLLPDANERGTRI